MDIFITMMWGFCFGLFFGVGCALAVMYSIYNGGYRTAVADSLREQKSDRYRHWLPWAEKKLEKEALAKPPAEGVNR
ncbi:hypothetical protein [Paracidobacterium acidisoli]|uniref:Uncharacterized protein n=1 Tax=Paracidobacterium acidisoli TaxID=2303751 RepID=A0A372IN50_9BACT|nr:hypothetical protein [Paracidobacterium acidisoli]MBT9331626.1 hypothetical protein [Paracidobacterium acidisoli]